MASGAGEMRGPRGPQAAGCPGVLGWLAKQSASGSCPRCHVAPGWEKQSWNRCGNRRRAADLSV